MVLPTYRFSRRRGQLETVGAPQGLLAVRRNTSIHVVQAQPNVVAADHSTYGSIQAIGFYCPA